MEQFPVVDSRESLPRQRNRASFFGLLRVAILAGHLAGCASIGLPTAEERTAVGSGEKAIVLLRVQCTIEGQQPYEPFAYALTEDNISFGLGSFETGGEPERQLQLRFVSPESRKNGWVYFVLPHGIHYLTVYPPRRTDVFTYNRAIKDAPRWRMDVPQDATLVYAGTLRFSGESDGLLFGGRIMRSIRVGDMGVANDEELARKLLAQEFPGFGEAQTLLLRRQLGPIILRSPLPSPSK